MNVFVLNCGSSSLKFEIYNTDLDKIETDSDETIIRGEIERIGSQSTITFKIVGKPNVKQAAPLRDHRAALQYVTKWLTEEERVPQIKSLEDIHAIGHRVVHGGEKFIKSVLINDKVIEGIEDCIDLAPLHNPANVKGIYACREIFGPVTPQIAVFDTAFHSTMPPTSYLYGIPYQVYRRYKIRKYGFHGTSHRYISYRYRRLSGKTREQTNIITCHLGNGSSACAIKKGKSVETSMGFTPLEGLMMGTRCGDIDPTVVQFLVHKEGITVDEAFNMLNKRSGVLGISGLTNDMRDLLEEIDEFHDRRALLAVDMFAKKVQKYIGAYMATLNGTDAICLSGGIGENSPEIRRQICQNLEHLGIGIDDVKNAEATDGKEMLISSGDVNVYVIPTNEELVIARDSVRVVEGQLTPLDRSEKEVQEEKQIPELEKTDKNNSKNKGGSKKGKK